ncbi:MAG: insulinase family protein [Spirochaetales bacterium]|nr:insulinase family protein [Spirochaetales bacterium]
MSTLKVGDSLHDFTVKSIIPLEEYRGEGIFLEHNKTGCQVYHLLRDDPENLFAFIFKTPAFDNTGAAHILEHSVLSGSNRFPVKDPFLSLMKGSMNTFLNAMTYPDKTVYPAASTVKKDYFNLMRVYGDAVFFPLLKEEIFLQEGHRLEPVEGGYSVAGVVYNEMQGAYSSHDTIVNEWSYRHLFPDTPYNFDSGGEPLEIPRLTYQGFKDFHKKYYHPSNCRIFLYGDIPTEEQLDVIGDEFLRGFERGEMIGDIPSPVEWDSPRSFFMTSALGEDGDSKSTFTMNWKTSSVTRPEDILSMEVLSEMLLGNVGAPLYKALVESNLGEDVSPSSGLDTEIKESVFSLGLRGCNKGDRAAFEELVESILSDLVENGIPAEVVKGALHQVEFRNREIRGGIPFGLRLMDKSLRGWLHGMAPWETMCFADSLGKLKTRLAEDPRFFEKLLKKQFLDNQHRSTLVVTPDKGHEKESEKIFDNMIEELTATLDDAGKEALVKKKEDFDLFQDEEDPPEVQNLIPTLHRGDLPHDISLVNTSLEDVEGVPFYFHDLYTHGIVYIDFAFDIRGFDKETSLFFPLFSRLISSSALPGMSYDQVALQLSLLSGGLYTFLESSPVIGRPGEEREYLFFRLKVLEKDLGPAMDLVERMFLESDISDETRIKDLLFEHRNDFKSSLLPMGHSLSALRGASKISNILSREEAWRGIDQYLFLNRTTGLLGKEGEAGKIGELLEGIRRKAFCRENLLVNITGSSSILPAARERVRDFAEMLKSCPQEEVLPETGKSWGVNKRSEGLIFPSAVGFTARVMPAAMAGSHDHSCELLLGHYMKTTLLWEEIRMKGGAYGASSSANGAEGLFSFTSYRDPKPDRSLDMFKEVLQVMVNKPITADELDKAVIGVVGKDTRPLSPGEKSMMGFRRDLYGVTDAIRRKNRENILGITSEDLSKAAAKLLEKWDEGVTVFLAGEEMAEKIEKNLDGFTYQRLELPG